MNMTGPTRGVEWKAQQRWIANGQEHKVLLYRR